MLNKEILLSGASGNKATLTVERTRSGNSGTLYYVDTEEVVGEINASETKEFLVEMNRKLKIINSTYAPSPRMPDRGMTTLNNYSGVVPTYMYSNYLDYFIVTQRQAYVNVTVT